MSWRQSAAALGARIARWFLFRDAEALARRLTAADRATLEGQLALITQKSDSAAVLAASEQSAEALALADQAVELVVKAAAWPPVGQAVQDPAATGENWAQTLAQLGASTAAIERLQLAELASQQGRPTRNPDVTPAHQRRTHNALVAVKTARRSLARLIRSPRRIVARRWLRITVVGLLALFALGAVLKSSLERGLVSVTASVSYDNDLHAPAKAVDGKPETEWLLPTRTLGFLEIRIKPQRLRRVNLRNGHNDIYNDRAARDFHIECYSEGKLISKVTGSFPRFEPAPDWTKVAVQARNVDTLRIVIDSYHKSGGGLAEISWD